MSTSLISRRYAVALFDLIGEGIELEADVAKVAAIVALDDMAELLLSPAYPAALKQDVIMTAVGKNVSSEVARLVAILAERNKTMLLPEISDMLEEMIRLAESEIDAEVTVAVAIDDYTKTKLVNALTVSTGKTVRVNVSEDKSILGGMVVQIGDRKIDYSLRTKLAGLHRALAS